MVSGWRFRTHLKISMWALALFWVAATLASLSHASEIDDIRMAIEAKGARWVAKENPISLLPKEERVKRLGLIKPFGMDLPVLAPPPPPAGFPLSLDWRDYNGDNYVTPVRDQGGCGSCWAFSTTAALESYTLISSATPGMDLDLAEQVLVSCGNAGNCGGGYPGSASNFIRDTGLPLETCYLYTAKNGNCSNACPNWQSSTYTIPSMGLCRHGFAHGQRPQGRALHLRASLHHDDGLTPIFSPIIAGCTSHIDWRLRRGSCCPARGIRRCGAVLHCQE